MGAAIAEEPGRASVARHLVDGVRPFERAPIVQRLEAGTDRPAVHHPGGYRPKLAVGGACHGLVEEAVGLFEAAELHQRVSLQGKAESAKIGIAETLAKIKSALGQRQTVFGIARGESQQALGEGEGALLDTVGLLLEMALSLGQPAGGRRKLETYDVVDDEGERNRAGPPVVALLDMECVGPLPRADQVLVQARPERRLAERFEIGRTEREPLVGGRKQIVAAWPIAQVDGFTGIGQRAVESSRGVDTRAAPAFARAFARDHPGRNRHIRQANTPVVLALEQLELVIEVEEMLLDRGVAHAERLRHLPDGCRLDEGFGAAGRPAQRRQDVALAPREIGRFAGYHFPRMNRRQVSEITNFSVS